MNENEKGISALFFPYTTECSSKIKNQNKSFAYYTSADTALKIIQNQEIWMRNAMVMNDRSEIHHGQTCLLESWEDKGLGGRLRQLLEKIDPTILPKIQTELNNRQNHRILQTYLISVSVHGPIDQREIKYGRLSMWRAYGGDANVAIIMKNAPFFAETSALNAFSSPVLYEDIEGFKRKFGLMVDGLEIHHDQLRKLDPEIIVNSLTNAFHFSVISTKHPGFAEEHEWRVIHSPSLLKSEVLKPHIETIQGVPQTVYKLKLQDYPDHDQKDLSIPELFEEIIIGPTDNPYPIKEALCRALTTIGMKNPWEKIRISNIPLRK